MKKVILTLILVVLTIITLTGCSEGAIYTPDESTTATTETEEVGLKKIFYEIKTDACEDTALTESYKNACLQALSEEYEPDQILDSFLKIDRNNLELYILLKDYSYRCFDIDGGNFIKAYEAIQNDEKIYYFGYEETDDGYVYVGRIQQTDLGYMLKDLNY